MRAVVLLPTFNERENVADLLRALRAAAPTIEVIVIDDSSPDGTADLAQAAADELGGVWVEVRGGKAGLGAAYRHGFQLAFDAGYDIVVSMDCDFSHDPAVVPDMVRLVDEGADVVIGSRYVDGGGTVDWPLRRRLLSKWGNRYTGALLGTGVRDCTSGFRAYRATTLAEIDPGGTSAEGYAFLTELVRRLARNGAKIVETPITFKDRVRGTSKMSGRIIVESMVRVTGWGLADRWVALRGPAHVVSDRALRWWVRVTVALPFAVALIALSRQHWTPVLDLAMTELRVRDVGGGDTPLIGLPGRIGTFPDQGSHPGPLSFYLLAPTYRIFGATSFGLLAGAVVVNVAAAWTALWVAARHGGRRLFLAIAAVLMTALAWLGANVLTQPWNPYLPLVAFMLTVLAGWAVLDGDHRMVIVQVVAATLCAQTHVPYLSLCVALVVLSFVAIGWRWWRARAVDRSAASSVAIAVCVGALLWLPVLIDEVRNDPGNVTMLRRHFLDPPDATQGLRVGVKTVLAHFDIVHLATRLPQRSSDYFEILGDLEGGSWMVGLVVFAIWVSAAAWSWRLADRRIVRLHTVVAVATAVAIVSTARIFGKVWYYLTLWAWVIGLLAIFATLWTTWAAIAPERRRRIPLDALAVAVLAIATTVFTVDAARVDPPEQHLGETLGDVVDPTADALAEGIGAAVGDDGRYAVVWSDAYYFGSQGYGLISELERRGFDARAYPTYRVPVTPQRITTADDVDAEVVLVTGVNVDRWRAIPGVAEVAFVEPRSAAELAEFDRLRTEVIAGLHDAGLDELLPLVDTNLFGLSVHPDIPGDLERLVARMLVLGEETAVFIAPPGTFDANP